MSTETNSTQANTRKPAMVRYRFSVPEKDVSVIRWVQNQSNVSQSIRDLIKNQIKRTGFEDVTCQEVHQLVPVGRPAGSVKKVVEESVMQTELPVQPSMIQAIPATPKPTVNHSAGMDEKASDMLESMY